MLARHYSETAMAHSKNMLLDDFIINQKYSQTYSYSPDYIMQVSSYKSYGSNQDLLMPPGTNETFLSKGQ